MLLRASMRQHRDCRVAQNYGTHAVVEWHLLRSTCLRGTIQRCAAPTYNARTNCTDADLMGVSGTQVRICNCLNELLRSRTAYIYGSDRYGSDAIAPYSIDMALLVHYHRYYHTHSMQVDAIACCRCSAICKITVGLPLRSYWNRRKGDCCCSSNSGQL